MKTIIFFLAAITIICPHTVWPQNKGDSPQQVNIEDYVFYDYNNVVCHPEKAYWYRGIPEKQGEQYPFIGYYINGQKYVYGFYSSLKSGGVRDGYFLYYDTLGFVLREGLYKNNQKEGPWKHYHKGTTKISYEAAYKKGMKEGYYRFYDTTGLITKEGAYQNDKQEGIWKHYRPGSNEQWYDEVYKRGDNIKLTSYYPGGRVKREEKYIRDRYGAVKLSGTCYDTSGREIEFTPFAIMPEFPGGMESLYSYFDKSIRYPKHCRDNGIQGRVIVSFAIGINGTIEDAQVIRSVHPELDNEALRVILAMPAWKPGLEDDIVKKTFYSLPISFR